MNESVSVSILTNSNRRKWLERCIFSLLENCYYRPLHIGIYDNGSTDDTADWLENHLPVAYGVNFEYKISDVDIGCASGTNCSIEFANKSRYHLHLESDFIHQSEMVTGVDKFWLHRAVSLLSEGSCDYLYLRRMLNDHDMYMHWWSQWMPNAIPFGDEYIDCPNFWWSNNPSLFCIDALKLSGTLPLDASIDGDKGTSSWSMPELKAKRPSNPMLHKWGMFFHEEMSFNTENLNGCGEFENIGASSCKYGFYLPSDSRFCKFCDLSKGIEDMPRHQNRFSNNVRCENLAICSVIKEKSSFDSHLGKCTDGVKVYSCIGDENFSLGRQYNYWIDNSSERFLLFCHPDVEFSDDALGLITSELSKNDIGGVGVVGVCSELNQVWGNGAKFVNNDILCFDSCFFAIDKEKGFRFDDSTFDGLHCVVEDYCYQLRDNSLKLSCIPVKKFVHHSDTVVSKGFRWGNYDFYRAKLNDKWKNKMLVVTT